MKNKQNINERVLNDLKGSKPSVTKSIKNFIANAASSAKDFIVSILSNVVEAVKYSGFFAYALSFSAYDMIASAASSAKDFIAGAASSVKDFIAGDASSAKNSIAGDTSSAKVPAVTTPIKFSEALKNGTDLSLVYGGSIVHANISPPRPKRCATNK